MKTNIFKTFAKTITTGFLCATVICGSVLGDVFEAKLENGDPVILAPDAFADWVALHPKMEGLQNKFTGNIWQMPGFAVFFPEGSSEHQQVYVAMKRQYQEGQSLADNNPEKAGGHVLNYSSNMHTERQLAIVALEEAILKRRRDTAATLFVANEGYNGATIGPLLPGAKIPQLLEPLDNEVSGDLYIYTVESPCQGRDKYNKNFSCADYYNALVQYFPHIKIHIYYKDPSINPQELSSKKEIVNGLIALIKKSARNETTSTIWCTEQEFALFKLGEFDLFKLDNDDNLLFNPSKDLKKQDWKKPADNASVFLNKVNRFLGCSSAEPEIITFKDQIIKEASAFVHPNISNNLIQAPSRDQ